MKKHAKKLEKKLNAKFFRDPGADRYIVKSDEDSDKITVHRISRVPTPVGSTEFISQTTDLSTDDLRSVLKLD
jgi:hypothetical protein